MAEPGLKPVYLNQAAQLFLPLYCLSAESNVESSIVVPTEEFRGLCFWPGLGRKGPCPGGLFFIGNQLPHNFKGASFFPNCRALSH